MIRAKNIAVVAFICASALLLATGASVVVGGDGVPEERPFRIHSDATVVADWEHAGVDADGRPFVPWTMTAPQLTTEGWGTNSGSGVMYLDTGVAEGSGVCAYVNGETIEWDSLEEFGTQHTAITFTGGTGRFENVTGGMTFDYTISNTEVDEEGNPLKMTYSYWGAGTITY